LESIIQFRQMMADQKFFELQRMLEVQLTIKSDARYELLSLYYESLKAQQKQIPSDKLIELAELSVENQRSEFAIHLLAELSPASMQRFYAQVVKIKIHVTESKGQMDELYSLVSSFLFRQFEKQIPTIPEWMQTTIQKYFAADFNLQLKELSLSLMVNDLVKSEALCRKMITANVEKSLPRGTITKLGMIADVLKSGTNKGHLEIYQNFCLISTRGISAPSDFKRIVEMIIFYNDFKFQVLVLNLLDHLKLTNEAQEYAAAIKTNEEYDYVYLDKFFQHLKSYFFKIANKEVPSKLASPAIDLKLSSLIKEDVISPSFDFDETEDESKYFLLLKHQQYTADQLCDLSVSFFQSEMPKVALKAAEMAMALAKDDKNYLKGCYLKLTCLLQLKDYRAALDTSLQALTRSKTKDDILSFLYGQAEIYIRLNQLQDAKNILSQIISIDSQYRSAKERLDKLNEI
jgi:tetratricopeptide (TPR) repeat protein